MKSNKTKNNLNWCFSTGLLVVVSILVLSCPIFINSVSAHRFHTTLTRIDVNEKEKTAEISIQMVEHDVRKVFETKYPKKFDLEKKEEAGKILFEYLVEKFVLKDRSGTVSKLRWIGYEMDADSVWLYAETDVRESLEGFQLQNSLFFEYYPEQSNLVICKFAGKKADLAFKAGDSLKEIRVRQAEK